MLCKVAVNKIIVEFKGRRGVVVLIMLSSDELSAAEGSDKKAVELRWCSDLLVMMWRINGWSIFTVVRMGAE